jgi:hypothetical protein
MISTMTQPVSNASGAVSITEAVEDTAADHNTTRSSSLSELADDDVSDIQSDGLSVAPFSGPKEMEVDSEAETERLDKSPLKQNNLASNTILEENTNALDQLIDAASAELDAGKRYISPSIEEAETDGLTPSASIEGNLALGKRKRPQSSINTPSVEETDEPSPKRALTDELQLDLAAKLADTGDVTGYESDEAMIVEETSITNVQETNGTIETDTIETEERIVVAGRRGRQSKKNRRKLGKQVVAGDTETLADASDTPAMEVEQAEEEVENEEDQAHDEERTIPNLTCHQVNWIADHELVAKRKVAATALAEIEKDFIAFRERYGYRISGLFIANFIKGILQSS